MKKRLQYILAGGVILIVISTDIINFEVDMAKECYQDGQPPGGMRNDCRFDEFCACDFYESYFFPKNKSPREKYKTYCLRGEKGICLHVCQLSILKPGSLFLQQEKLITATEACKLSPHSQCIGYNKQRCLQDGISEKRCFPHVPVCVCEDNYRGVWGADEDVRERDRRCKRCDCYENGTKYCLKRAYDYCKCRSGYKGNKCNYFKHLAISNGPLTNNNNMDEIRDYSSNIRFHSNGNKRQEKGKANEGQDLYGSN